MRIRLLPKKTSKKEVEKPRKKLKRKRKFSSSVKSENVSSDDEDPPKKKRKRKNVYEKKSRKTISLKKRILNTLVKTPSINLIKIKEIVNSGRKRKTSKEMILIVIEELMDEDKVYSQYNHTKDTTFYGPKEEIKKLLSIKNNLKKDDLTDNFDAEDSYPSSSDESEIVEDENVQKNAARWNNKRIDADLVLNTFEEHPGKWFCNKEISKVIYEKCGITGKDNRTSCFNKVRRLTKELYDEKRLKRIEDRNRFQDCACSEKDSYRGGGGYHYILKRKKKKKKKKKKKRKNEEFFTDDKQNEQQKELEKKNDDEIIQSIFYLSSGESDKKELIDEDEDEVNFTEKIKIEESISLGEIRKEYFETEKLLKQTNERKAVLRIEKEKFQRKWTENEKILKETTQKLGELKKRMEEVSKNSTQGLVIH